MHLLFLGSRRFRHLLIQHTLNRQWLPEDLLEVAPPTLATHYFQTVASYVERHAYKLLTLGCSCSF